MKKLTETTENMVKMAKCLFEYLDKAHASALLAAERLTECKELRARLTEETAQLSEQTATITIWKQQAEMWSAAHTHESRKAAALAEQLASQEKYAAVSRDACAAEILAMQAKLVEAEKTEERLAADVHKMAAQAAEAHRDAIGWIKRAETAEADNARLRKRIWPNGDG